MPDINAQTNPESTGARLRATREARGLSTAEIGGTLRIKPAFLEALEADRPEALPTPTHASGFLRSYARYLGVELAPLPPAPPVGQPVTKLAHPAANSTADKMFNFVPPLLVIGTLIVIYALWQWLQPAPPAPIAPPPASLETPKLQPLEPKIEPKAEIKTEPKVEQSLAVETTTQAAPAETPLIPAQKKIEPSVDTVAKADVKKADSVTVRAVSDAWVQITDAKGVQLYSKLMRAGEFWRAPQQAGLRLSTGNAGGLVLVRNGEAGGPLGATSQVLRNLVITTAPVAAPASKPTPVKPAEPATADDSDSPDTEE